MAVLGAPVWDDGALYTNPSDGQVLATTPELGEGSYLIGVTGSASADWVYDIQQRNAANDASLHAQRRRAVAGNDDFLFPNKISVAAGERVRVVLSGSLSGTVQMSLLTQAVD